MGISAKNYDHYRNYHSHFSQFRIMSHFLNWTEAWSKYCAYMYLLIYSITLTVKVKSCQLISLKDDQINKSHFWVYLWEPFQTWLNPEDSNLRNSLIHLWILYLNRLSECGKLEGSLEQLLRIVFINYVFSGLLLFSLHPVGHVYYRVFCTLPPWYSIHQSSRICVAMN